MITCSRLREKAFQFAFKFSMAKLNFRNKAQIFRKKIQPWKMKIPPLVQSGIPQMNESAQNAI